jgi:hypothetical protein
VLNSYLSFFFNFIFKSGDLFPGIVNGKWLAEQLEKRKNQNPPQILYQATRDGIGKKGGFFSKSSNEIFHSKCDQKGPTITICKLADGHIFGGFTSVNWSSARGWKSDPRAFLFSLTDGKGRGPQKCPLKQGKSDWAVIHRSDQGSLFRWWLEC